MDNLRPGMVFFLGLRLMSLHSEPHDVAKGEKSCGIGVTFRIPVTQLLIVGIQDGALSTLIFVVLQDAAGASRAVHARGFHTLSTILSVSCRQPLRTCTKMRFAPRLICFQKKTGS